MTGGVKLGHVGLFTRNLDKMIDFYSQVLGLIVTDRGDIRSGKSQIVFLSSDPGEHHQFVLVQGGQNDAEKPAVQQVSFLVDSLDDLRTTQDRVTNTGTEIVSTTTHGNAWSIYFRDPDNNRIEVYTHTPWYIPQPHGHPLDLSLSNAEIIEVTEAHCREDPKFMPAAEREKVMAKAMTAAD